MEVGKGRVREEGRGVRERRRRWVEGEGRGGRKGEDELGNGSG